MAVATQEMSRPGPSSMATPSSPIMRHQQLMNIPHPPPRPRAGSMKQPTRHRPRPIPNSYWATPYLVACEFPYCPVSSAQVAEAHTKQKLDSLLIAGVRTFIDLTEPHELFPYQPHLETRCALVGINYAEVEYHNFPIRDRCLPESVDIVRSIMETLSDNEARGRVAAVHCRGGIGRTGLIVGCWLVECGIARDGDDALSMIAAEWKTVEKCKRYPLSPETGPQHEYVRTFERAAWIDAKQDAL